MADTGTLQISLVAENGSRPVSDANVYISSTGQPEQVLEVLPTNNSGQTEAITLDAPPKELSLIPGEFQPYSEYNIRVQREGFEDIVVAGTQIFSEEQAFLNLRMTRKQQLGPTYEVLAVGPHTLYGDYPPKIAEPEIKERNATGEIVLSRVVVPEYVIVHDGAVTDQTASDYYVLYRDYIKNVTSCEIYATWPEETIRANVLAIMSFTLNRVYTEWYRDIRSFRVKTKRYRKIFIYFNY